MSEELIIALITAGLALCGTVGVGLIQTLPAPRRLERQVTSLSTLAPLVRDELPMARDAFEAIAIQITRSYSARPWWHRILFGSAAVILLAATVAVAWDFADFLTDKTEDGVWRLHTFEGSALLVAYVAGTATLAVATLTTAFSALFARYGRPGELRVERAAQAARSHRGR